VAEVADTDRRFEAVFGVFDIASHVHEAGVARQAVELFVLGPERLDERTHRSKAREVKRKDLRAAGETVHCGSDFVARIYSAAG